MLYSVRIAAIMSRALDFSPLAMMTGSAGDGGSNGDGRNAGSFGDRTDVGAVTSVG
jgi:hypothetical protein